MVCVYLLFCIVCLCRQKKDQKLRIELDSNKTKKLERENRIASKYYIYKSQSRPTIYDFIERYRNSTLNTVFVTLHIFISRTGGLCNWSLNFIFSHHTPSHPSINGCLSFCIYRLGWL